MNYFDKLLYHEIMAIYYGNSITADIAEEFEEVIRQIENLLKGQKTVATRKQARELLLYIYDLLNFFEDELEKDLEDDVEDIINGEVDWFSSLLQKETDKKITIPKTLVATVLLMPYTARDNIKSFVKKFSTNVRNSAANVINAGMFLSSPTEQIAENMNKVMKNLKTGLSSEVQTIVKSTVDNTQNIIKKANPKIFTGYKWCSILDSKTCDICEDLNNTVYSTIGDAPFAPIHYRCRCQLIGFLRESVEPEWSTFGRWIESQTEEVQRKVLGKKRFDLWKNGDLELKDFVNDGQKIKLKDLYKSV